MNIRELPSGLFTGSRDFLSPVIIRSSAVIAASFYRGIHACKDYRPDPDKDSPAPCLNCGRPASEHGKEGA